MKRRQLLGLLGAGILMLGVFVPLIRLPVVGSMNYFHNGRGDGVIVLVLAVISALLVLGNAYKGLWLTAGGSLCVTIYTFVNFQTKLSDAKSQMNTDLAGNPFRGIADMAMESVELQWGWLALLAGIGLLFFAAASEIEDKPQQLAVPATPPPTTPPAAPTRQARLKEKLHELQELRDSGLITEQEYQAKRQALLDGF